MNENDKTVFENLSNQLNNEKNKSEQIKQSFETEKLKKRACRALRERSSPKHRKRSFRKSFLSAELFQERIADGSAEQIKNEI